MTSEAVRDVLDIAAEQWGLVTTAQASRFGVSAQAMARFGASGRLERVTHGVYRVAGVPPSPLDDLRAAWLGLDPGRLAAERLRDDAPAVVSHRSAAALHRLGDLDADVPEFLVPGRVRRAGVSVHRGGVGADEWTVINGLPVTTVPRTVDDLARAHLDGGHLASIVRDALIRALVDDARLTAVLDRHGARYLGTPVAGEELLAHFLREAGLPEPLRRAVRLVELPAAAVERGAA